MNTLVNWAIVLLVFSAGATYTILYPILVPTPMIQPAINLISGWFQWNSVIPIQEIYNCLVFDIALLVLFFILKLMLMFVSLVLSGEASSD